MSDWNDVVKIHAAKVLNAALRVTGNMADAEDVGQQVFLEVFSKPGLNPNQDLAGLLVRMTVFRAIDHVRSKRTTEYLPPNLADQSVEAPVEQAVARETESRLRKAITYLPKREAEVFCLSFFERLSHEEIAQQLQVSKNSVTKSLCLARTKIQEKFTSGFRRIECQ